MPSTKRSGLLGPGFMLLVAGTLALAACSSDSGSGGQPTAASKPTQAEAKSPPSLGGSGPKGLIGAAVSKVR